MFLAFMCNEGDRIRVVTIEHNHMSDRFTVTLADGLAADLQRWATDEGRAKANLASFLIELAIRQKYPEKYPPASAKSRRGSRDDD